MPLPCFLRVCPPVLLVALLIGCGNRQPVAQVDPASDGPVAPGSAKPVPSLQEVPAAQQGTPIIKVEPGSVKEGGESKVLDLPVAPSPALSPAEKYDAALLDALGLMVDRKYAEALAALKLAQTAQDTEQIRAEIDRVKRLLEEQAAAERTQADIRTVLDGGKPDEAAQLAGSALQQYGGSDAAEPLVTLKRQADALATAQIDDTAARRERFRQEADLALREKNLRGAALALEQALQFSNNDPALQAQLDDVRSTLARYDEQRRRAAALRRDPANLEEALAALQEAAKAWDTAQIRQEIDEYTLALQKRRDRLAVAAFEVRGDIGIPAAGQAIADELLPAFKVRYDLVERGPLGKVLDELRLESQELAANGEARQQVGQLTRIRYLVVGSVTPLNGLLVQARLIEVQTGLVVQTGRMIAGDPIDMMRRLPQLAALLQMSDEQKMSFEKSLAQQPAFEVRPAAEFAPLPPPPPPPDPGVVLPAPPPIIAFTPQPVALGGLVIQDFANLPPPPPPGGVLVAADLLFVRDNPVKRRLFQVSIELGDNLFRRGRYQEAHRHFELALGLSLGREEIRVRLERCRPFLPPPPPPVVVPPPLVVTPPRVVVVTPPIRPRIAIFNFLVNCRPGLVPVGIDNWAADNLASYFAPTHVVIDRGEVCWWMGRLGITMRDVLNNPSARHGLAQALNARFFIFGAIQQTASFEVTTHMIDAETGARSGGGRIHVQDHTEMKLRLAELVHQTTLKPDEAARLAREGSDNEKVLNESRRLLKAGQYTQAAAVARTGLKSSPNNVALKSLLAQAEQQAEKARLEEARKREAERQQALALAARQREAALLQQAQAARRRAEQEARTRDDAARRAQEARKEQAYTQMLNQARTALKQGNPQRAVGFFESALALKPNEAGNQELALAKARQKEAAQMRAVEQDRQRREAEAKKRQEELARARARVEEEQQRRQAEEQIRRKEQEDRDQAQYTRLVDQARGLLARQQREAALAVLQAARRVKNSDEVEQLIAQTQEAQLRAEAQKKSEQARIELDRKLAQEKALREKIESEARKKQQAYQAALEQAQKALVEKRYDQAIASYQVAGKLFRTDAVLAGLQQAKQARGAEIARAEEQKRLQADLEKKRAMEERKKKEEEKQRGDFGRRMAEGRQALQAKRYQEAARIFGEALKLQPADAEAKQALQLALQGARTPPPPPPQRQPSPEYTRLMSQGQEFLAAKRYDEAIKAFSEALKIVPNDTAATKGLREAKQAVRTPPSVPPPAKPPAEYTSLIQAAAAAEKQQKYAEAVQAYRQALRIRPGDARASQGADFAQHMSDGQKLLAARKFSEAAREFQAALKLSPGNPTAKTLLQRARERRP